MAETPPTGTLRRRPGRAAPVLAGVALALTAHPEQGMAKTFRLSISGEDGAGYSGACTITGTSGEERIGLEGSVPLQRAFEGDGLTCRFDARGQVVVEIAHDGSRSRGASSGGVIQLSAR
jgi:hypothetical protein